MKAKVLNEFYDTVARVMRRRGDIIEVTPARFCELANNGRFVESVKATDEYQK